MASNNNIAAALLVATLSLAAVTPCFAQAPAPSTEPNATDKETARQLMDLGDEKFTNGDYAGALQDYQGADSIMGLASTGVVVGKTLAKLGRLIEARDKLLAVTRLPAVEGESPVLAEARAEAERLQQAIANRIPSLSLAISGVPDDAEVTIVIGGQPVPSQVLSLPRTVDPGTHTIDASCPGYDQVTLKITVTEGEQRKVEVVFKREQRGSGLPPEDDGVSALAIAGFSVGGLGIVVGAITGGVSLSQAADVKDQCVNDVCPVALEGDKDSSVTLGHVSTVSFVVGGLGVALGVVALILDSQQPSAGLEADTGSVHIEPLVGFGSLGVRGRF
jgi:hypothetical protein